MGMAVGMEALSTGRRVVERALAFGRELFAFFAGVAVPLRVRGACPRSGLAAGMVCSSLLPPRAGRGSTVDCIAVLFTRWSGPLDDASGPAMRTASRNSVPSYPVYVLQMPLSRA